MSSPKNIRIADFDYPLPDELIARHPLQQRDACRLLVGRGAEAQHLDFSALPHLMEAGTLMVRNNTRVINARVRFRKETGAEIEVFLLDPLSPADYALSFQSRKSCRWSCLVGNLKRWKEGELTMPLKVDGKDILLRARRIRELEGNSHEIEFSWDGEVTFADVIERAGRIPIPPYLKRASEDTDSVDYQTVYAQISGSVAAPTAGLHFTPSLLEEISRNGVEISEVTLHVGAGTFQPVKSDLIGEHPMHTEVFSVDKTLIQALIRQLEAGRPIAAVGTTTVRTLESLPYLGAALRRGEKDLHVNQWDPYCDEKLPSTADCLKEIIDYMETIGEESLTASTAIMIAPGFQWRLVDILITNFHQPQSTLLLLVSSFLGEEGLWRKYYDEALALRYRFLSYGDACLFFHQR